jgi:hypothetical protein
MIGSAGGVGDAVGDPGVNGAIGDDVDGVETGGSPPSHAANSSTKMPTHIEMRVVRKRNAPPVGDDHEDTHSLDPW